MQIKLSRNFKIISIGLIILLSSCSLKYSETVDASKEIPEFSFRDASLTRYENKDITVQMDVAAMEQYKNSSTSYAQGIDFKAYGDKGNLSTEGKCDYLLTDTDAKQYELFGNIELKNYDDNTSFFAQSLRWNEKSEQLTSGKSETVRIEKDDTIIYGSGFSASGISKTFNFTGVVSGQIITSNSKEQADE